MVRAQVPIRARPATHHTDPVSRKPDNGQSPCSACNSARASGGRVRDARGDECIAAMRGTDVSDVDPPVGGAVGGVEPGQIGGVQQKPPAGAGARTVAAGRTDQEVVLPVAVQIAGRGDGRASRVIGRRAVQDIAAPVVADPAQVDHPVGRAIRPVEGGQIVGADQIDRARVKAAVGAIRANGADGDPGNGVAADVPGVGDPVAGVVLFLVPDEGIAGDGCSAHCAAPPNLGDWRDASGRTIHPSAPRAIVRAASRRSGAPASPGLAARPRARAPSRCRMPPCRFRCPRRCPDRLRAAGRSPGPWAARFLARLH
jgi:hypothetical protein